MIFKVGDYVKVVAWYGGRKPEGWRHIEELVGTISTITEVPLPIGTYIVYRIASHPQYYWYANELVTPSVTECVLARMRGEVK